MDSRLGGGVDRGSCTRLDSRFEPSLSTEPGAHPWISKLSEGGKVNKKMVIFITEKVYTMLLKMIGVK